MKRFLALAGSLVAGAAGALVLASPAYAHHPNVKGEAECQVDGTYKVTWTAGTDNFSGRFMRIYEVQNTPDGDLSVIKDEAWFDPGTPRQDVQTVPGTTTQAKLSFKATWHETKDASSDVLARHDRKEATVRMPGKCVPVTAAAQGDCTSLNVTVTTMAEHDATTATVKYGTQTKTAELADGGDTKKVDLSPGSETEVTVTFAGSNQVFKSTYQKPANCGGLPVTGSSTTTLVAGGTGAAALGTFIFFMARRRMVKLRQLANG